MQYPVFALFLALLLTLLGSCNKSGGGQAGSQTDDGKPVPAQVSPETYFSAENPGKWKERANEHEMVIREGRIHYSGTTRLRELVVTVPLAGDNRHYLEAGVAMDHALKKELDKVSFKPGTPQYDFKLNIPADSPYASYIVIKCNQHDMWIKRVEPLPIKKESGD